jgi:hypothetical protein
MASPVITNAAEYEKAHSDLRILEQRIADLEREHPVGEKGFTKAGVRKMIVCAHRAHPLP